MTLLAAAGSVTANGASRGSSRPRERGRAGVAAPCGADGAAAASGAGRAPAASSRRGWVRGDAGAAVGACELGEPAALGPLARAGSFSVSPGRHRGLLFRLEIYYLNRFFV